MAEIVHLSLIDESNIADHTRLRADDTCYYLYEYTSGKNYAFSATNSLVSNLKKKPGASSENELYYKVQAIKSAAADLRKTLNPAWLATVTLVPVPSSKAIGHANYDNRIERICRLLATAADVRNLVIQNGSTVAAHEAQIGERVTVEELLALYTIDESLTAQPVQAIGIVDDVLTAGTHYRAMHSVLHNRFPTVPIVGLFLARRVFPISDTDF